MAENNCDETVDPIIYIWLDDTIETSNTSREIKKRIQQMVKGRLETFADPDKCVDHITDITKQKIFFIVSNKFGHYIVPLIYDLPQIDTVYVYCRNQQAANSWVKPHLKVRQIFTNQQLLLRQIYENVGACDNDNDNDLSMSSFQDEKQTSLQKLTDGNTKFMWYQAILTVLLFMAKYFNSKDDMIVASRACYHDNKVQKERIETFEQTYTPEKAFWWYTYDSFVYRLLNKALRTQDIEIIFKFRFFINDLHKQIQQLYRQYLTKNTEKDLRFYRGQKMSMDEVELLKNNIGGIISMNSFLSTTRTREVAEMFAGADIPCDEGSSLQSVLFIINVYDIGEDTTEFAFIKRFACNEAEDEVLFTIGAIFKVESVKKENNTWHIYLKLSKQQNQQHKDFSKYMIKQLGSQPGPTAFGWFLYRSGSFNGAIRYAEYILKQLSMEDQEMGDAYNLLGLIHKDLKKLDDSVEYYKKALEAYSRSNSSNNAQVIAIHHNLGLAYLAMGDNRLADEQRWEADALLVNSSLKDNPLLIGMTTSLKAKLQTAHGNLTSAFQSLEVVLAGKKKQLPSKHPSIATTLNEMGIVQEKMGHDEKALEYFKQALDMCRDCLTTNHFDLSDYHANIGRIYYKREQYELALEEFESALKIITDYTRDENENIVILMKCISDTNDILNPRTD